MKNKSMAMINVTPTNRTLYFIAGMFTATAIINNYYYFVIQRKLSKDENKNSDQNSVFLDWERKDFYDHLKFLNQKFKYSDDQHEEFIVQQKAPIKSNSEVETIQNITIQKLTPKASCISMLNDGQWIDENVNHTLCSQDENCKANVWKPKSCQWHAYTTKDTRACLKNEKILILGDSRGRQGYIGLKNRLTGDNTLYDEVEHHDLKFNLYGTSVEWYWTVNINDGKMVDRLTEILESDDVDNWPDLIILHSLLLHPTSHANRSVCEFELNNFKKDMTKKIFPILKSLIEKAQKFTRASKNLRILYLGSEDLKRKPVPELGYTSEVQNYYLQQHNIFMEKLIEQYAENNNFKNQRSITGVPDDFMNFPKINYVDLMTRTAYTKSDKGGELMMSDGTHKLDRRVETQVPTSLWVDTNGILNYFCNEKMMFEDVDCCV